MPLKKEPNQTFDNSIQIIFLKYYEILKSLCIIIPVPSVR